MSNETMSNNVQATIHELFEQQQKVDIKDNKKCFSHRLVRALVNVK